MSEASLQMSPVTPRPEVAAVLRSLRFKRRLVSRQIPKRNDGRCVWCDKPSKRKYCGEPCRMEFYVRYSGSYARQRVFNRDHGVCAKCKKDTVAERRDKKAEVKLSPHPWAHVGHTWEADHILPVSKGGGCCGLDNYQTLCLDCHKALTTQLLRERAKNKNEMLRVST